MTSLSTIKEWFDYGMAQPDVTHMIIKWDYFDGPHGDYPVYVVEGQDPRAVARINTDRTVECYSMSIPWEEQAVLYRANNWD